MTRTAGWTVDGTVTVVDRSDVGRGDADPVGHGKEKFLNVLSDHGSVEAVGHWTRGAEPYVVIGSTDDTVIGRLLDTDVAAPESVVYEWTETGAGMAFVVAGTDERGLMYALLELAERVEVGGLDALAAVEETVETPDNDVRGVDRFLMGPTEDTWFYDDEFWRYYLDRLARCRFNRFVLVTGYDTSFMSPPYPFVVNVPGYPDVRISDTIDASRDVHREQLRTIGRLCDRYGLEFVLGIWQQRPQPRHLERGQELLVENLPEDASDLATYCARGLERLLFACPEIEGIQLRVNNESGVYVGEKVTAEAFWREIIDAAGTAAAERERGLRLDLRAKGLTRDMLEWALETGLDVTVPTKFWCESTGLPYHNTRMREGELANLEDLNRRQRYSYADFLRSPRAYDVLYRLWVIGTNRIFVWGDPDYARRFSHATGFGDGIGFEVTAPLSMKGGHYSLQDEPWPLFEDPDLRYYEYEDERYWAWYRLFGRLGYSRESDPAVWEREFAARFGDAADAVQRGYRAASKVLPLITAFHLTSHPATVNWTEMDTGGALFADHNYNEAFGGTTYRTAEPSDPGLFYGVDEFVTDSLADDLDGRYTPLQVSRWLAHLASVTRRTVEAADPDAPDTGEYRATRLDFLMLADLAAYHAAKARAAVALERYLATEEAASLQVAHRHMMAALGEWESLAERGMGTYHDDLVFAMGAERADAGQWRDRLGELRADIGRLETLLAEEGIDPDLDGGDAPAVEEKTFPLPSFAAAVPAWCRADTDLTLGVRTGALADLDDLRLRYRRADQTEGEFECIEMVETDRGYRGTIPGEYLTPEYDLLVYFATTDDDGNGVVFPGLYHTTHPEPYHVIEVTE